MSARYPSLEGRPVLITGGATGIGAAMVEAFTRQGAKVGFIDIDDAAGTALASRLEGRPHFVQADLTDIAAASAAIDAIAGALGPIRVLVNNAANDERHDTAEVSVAYFDHALAVNLRHQFFCAQAVHAQMCDAGGGSIINFSSIAWMSGAPRLAVYAAAKAAVIGMTRTLAKEYGPDNIRVNAIAPGAVITERQRRLWLDDDQIAAIVERQCLKQRLDATAIADAVLFLASDDSRMITKQCLTVDAGLR